MTPTTSAPAAEPERILARIRVILDKASLVPDEKLSDIRGILAAAIAGQAPRPDGALAEARRTALEEAAKVAEAADRTGREWVQDSLWDAMRKQTAKDIRSLLATPENRND